MTWITFVAWSGWMAALLILGAYSLLSFGKIQARSSVYQWMNILGAVGFIINCAWNAAWPSVALNVDPEEAFVAAISSCHMLTAITVVGVWKHGSE